MSNATKQCGECLGSGWHLAGVPSHLKAGEIAAQRGRMWDGRAVSLPPCHCCAGKSRA